MADVELLYLGNLGDRTEVSRSEAVARVYCKLELGSEPRGLAQCGER